MNIEIRDIDGGRGFDWGKTSADYAKYRDIYPEIFYERIAARGLCVSGQRVLDLGTGTGVLPRNMYRFGAKWTGADISENQIAEARRLSEEAGQDIEYIAKSAENVCFPDESFDVITACQCIWYFDHERVMPRLARMLKTGGKFLALYMAWLPLEDAIAGESEKIVLKHNSAWTGANETRHPLTVPECTYKSFREIRHEEYDVNVPFTRESWHGRMKACRGVGASISGAELAAWEKEHWEMLEKNALESFEVRHFVATLELEKL